jgi:hypothetical protein
MNLETIASCPNIDSIISRFAINGFDAPGGTDKQSLHSFGPVYEYLLLPFAEKPVNLLEIGVQHGGSLLLWQHLLPFSMIYGVDIEDKRNPHVLKYLDSDRTHFTLGDAYTSSVVEQLSTLVPTGFDFIIDDGPHTLESQCIFLDLYLPLLNENGVAVIEDIQYPSWFKELRRHLPPGWIFETVDRRRVKSRYDDLMFVVRKGQH